MRIYFVLLIWLIYVPFLEAQMVKGERIHDMDEYVLNSDNYVPHDRFVGFKSISAEERKRIRFLKKGVIVEGEIKKFEGQKGEWIELHSYKIHDTTYFCGLVIEAKYVSKIPFGLFKYIGQGIGEEYGLSTGDTLYGRIYPDRTYVKLNILKINRLLYTKKPLVINKTDLEIIDADYTIGNKEEIDVFNKKMHIDLFQLDSILIMAGFFSFLGLLVGFTARDHVSISENNILLNDNIRLTLNFINGKVTYFNVIQTIRRTIQRVGDNFHSSSEVSYQSIVNLKCGNKSYEIVRDYSIKSNIYIDDTIFCVDGMLKSGLYKNLPFMIIFLPRLDEYIRVPKRYYWQISYSLLDTKKIIWFISGCILSIIITPFIVYQLYSKQLESLEIPIKDFFTKGDYCLNIISIGILFSIMAIVLSKLIRTFLIKSKVTKLIVNFFNSKSNF